MIRKLIDILSRGEFTDLKNKVEQLQSEVDTTRSQLNKSKIYEESQDADLRKAEEIIQAKDETINGLHRRIYELSSSLEVQVRLSDKCDELTAELEEQRIQLEESKTQKEKLKEDLRHAETSIRETEQANTKLTVQLKEQTVSVEENAQKLKELTELHEILKTDYQRLQQQLEEQKEIPSHENDENNSAEIKDTIDGKSESESDNTPSVSELHDRLEILENEKLLLQEEIKRSKRRYDDLLIEHNVSITNIEFYKKRINELEEELQVSKKVQPEELHIIDNYEKTAAESKEEPKALGNSVVPDQLKIDKIVDIENGTEVDSREFFSKPEDEILHMRRYLQEAIILDKPKFVCKYCGQMVKISGRCSERGRASFFSHLYDSDDCDLKTTTGLSKALINARKYGLYGESERHKEIKEQIIKALESENSLKKGVTDIQKEKTVFGMHPLFKWRRPDVYIKFNDIEIVFELQLSTTFASVIAEREMFYKMNNIFIVWVFNFAANEEHVDLRNLMMKDIYYENHRNVFVIDSEAIYEGIKRKELVLKCDWLEANGQWHYSGDENYGCKGEFVTLSDLTYDKSTYKPYYHKISNEQAISVDRNSQKETKEVLALLDKKYEKILQKQNDEAIKRKTILDALDVDSIIKEYVRLDVAVVKKDDRYGIYNYVKNKEILPPEYRSIKLWNNSRYFLVEDESMKFGLINSKGEFVVPTQYDSIPKPENGISMATYIDKESGMKMSSFVDVSTSNDISVNKGFLNIEKVSDNTYISTKNVNGAFLKGLIYKSGRGKTKNIYTTLKPFSEGLLVAVKNGKWGLINENGNTILDFLYDNIGDLENGKALVVSDDKSGYLDPSGAPIYDSVISVKKTNGTEKRKFLNEWKVYDKNGRVLSKKGFCEIAHYQGHIASFTQNEIIITESVWADKECGLYAELIEKTKTGLIFNFGGRVAKMNKRQLQRKPDDLVFEKGKSYKVYVSCIKEDVNLIYLSPIPCFGPAVYKKRNNYRY